MPLTLKEVTSRTVEADLTLDAPALFGDEKPTLHVAYRPSVLTPEFESEVRALGDQSSSYAALLARLIISWDFTGDNGKPYPLDEASLSKLPAPFLGAAMLAIRDHLSPNRKTGGSLDGGS